MTQLGVHALVWSGTWDEAGARHAISSAAAAGFDLIEVPILDPFGIDTEMTRRLLDEPSAALGVQETARVEELIMDVKSQGVTILLISHNFEQVLRLSDQVQVMRAGRTVARRRTSETDGQELVGLVTGAIMDPETDPEAPAAEAPVSEVSSNGRESVR